MYYTHHLTVITTFHLIRCALFEAMPKFILFVYKVCTNKRMITQHFGKVFYKQIHTFPLCSVRCTSNIIATSCVLLLFLFIIPLKRVNCRKTSFSNNFVNRISYKQHQNIHKGSTYVSFSAVKDGGYYIWFAHV